jgi:hypothetical protein
VDWTNLFEAARSPPGGVFPYIESTRASFLRSPKWRYVEVPERGTQALYQMRSDPEEKTDRCGSQPAICNFLRNQLEAWRAEIRPTPLRRAKPKP